MGHLQLHTNGARLLSVTDGKQHFQTHEVSPTFQGLFNWIGQRSL